MVVRPEGAPGGDVSVAVVVDGDGSLGGEPGAEVDVPPRVEAGVAVPFGL